MESPTNPKPFKDKTFLWGPLIILWTILGTAITGGPHQIYNITWVITNTETGKTANATSVMASLTDGFPALPFDLCDLVGPSWNPSDQEPFPGYGCHHPMGRYRTRDKGLYVCPGQNIREGCGGARDGYCASWGCETTGDAYWNPSSSWDLITLKRDTSSQGGIGPCYNANSTQEKSMPGATVGGKCNPLIITFTSTGKAASWDGPKTWGIRLYRTGYDPVALFSLTRQISSPAPTHSVGPNQVLPEQRPPSQPIPPALPQGTPTTPPANTTITPRPPGTGDRLLNLIKGAFLTLNATNPNRTQECWLCLVSRPPYYEGVAIQGNYTNHTSPPTKCNTNPQHKLTPTPNIS
jgi:hypothetical protein